MRKSLQLQEEDARSSAPASSTSRSTARTARRWAARRSMPPWWWNWRCRRSRGGSPCACIRWTIPPSKGHRHHRRARPATLVHIMLPKVERPEDVERAARAPRCRRREGPAAAGPDRIAGRVVLRHRRPSPHAVPQLRPDGLRSAHGGAIPSRRDGRAGPVHAPAGGARQARDLLRLPCPRQGALAWRGDGVQGPGRFPGGRVARSQRVRLHAHVEHPP